MKAGKKRTCSRCIGVFAIVGAAVSCGSQAAESPDSLSEELPSGSDTATLAGSGSEHFRCEGDTPLEEGNGLFQCANGMVHRRECEGASPNPCLTGGLLGTADFLDGLCRTDADCKEGMLCIRSRKPYMGVNCTKNHLREVFACQTPEDTCGTTDDCPQDLCLFDEGRHYCGSFSLCAE